MSSRAQILKGIVKGTNIKEGAEEGLLHRYLMSRGIDPRYVTKDVRISHSKSGQFLKWKSQHNQDNVRDPMSEEVDKKDTVTLDIPLIIRVLELAREDLKSDMDLHKVVEKLIEIRNKGTLTMDDYEFIANIKEDVMSSVPLEYIKEAIRELTEESLDETWKYHTYPDNNVARAAVKAHHEFRDEKGMASGNPARAMGNGKVAYKGEFKGPKPQKSVTEGAGAAQPGQRVTIKTPPRMIDVLPGDTYEVRTSDSEGVTLKHGLGTRHDNVKFPHGTYKIAKEQGVSEAKEANYGGDYQDSVKALKAKAEKKPVDMKSLAARMQASYAKDKKEVKEDISRRGILKGILGGAAAGAAGKASAIAGAFPSPSTRAKWAKDAADSNAAEARRQAEKRKQELEKNTKEVDKAQRVNHHSLATEETLDEVSKQSTLGRILRGHELKKKVDSSFKKIGDAQKNGVSGSKAFRDHERYANLERPGTWTKVKEETLEEGNGYDDNRTGFAKKPREDDEGYGKPKFKAKSTMDRPHTVHIDGKPWKKFSSGHQANAAVNTLTAKGKKAVAIAHFKEETLDEACACKKEMSKSARMIKAIYKHHKVVKEDTYDHEKDDKSIATYGKKPKVTEMDKDVDAEKQKIKAAAVLSGGSTLTGEPRDTVEIDPIMRVRPGQPDPAKNVKK